MKNIYFPDFSFTHGRMCVYGRYAPGARGAGREKGGKKNRGTVITSLQLAFTERVALATQAFDWSLDNTY